jgi:Na+-transporting methylmalonyl-CoA/oxaloacetate decarboxylase gamma subunit
MEFLSEIATTGSPAIAIALGMGTVFSCLALLYWMARVIGSWLPRLLGPEEKTAPVEFSGPKTQAQSEAVPATRNASSAEEGGIVTAMLLALARHRSSRTRSLVGESTGIDPWKIAGRIRTLRGK